MHHFKFTRLVKLNIAIEILMLFLRYQIIKKLITNG